MKKETPLTPLPAPSGRTHNQWGKWVLEKTKSKVMVCVCGNKYIVTREKQTLCIDCIYGKFS